MRNGARVLLTSKNTMKENTGEMYVYGKVVIQVAIRLPTDATVYFVKNLFPLFLPYMFRALISPSSEVSQAVFYIQPFGSCGVYVAHLRVPGMENCKIISEFV